MPMALYPVENGLDLVTVILLSEHIVRGPVRLAGISRGGRAGAAVDFRSEVVVHTFARRSGQDLIGRMLVRPSGQQMMLVSDLKNGVHLEVLIRINRRAGFGVYGQLSWIDQSHGVIGQ